MSFSSLASRHAALAATVCAALVAGMTTPAAFAAPPRKHNVPVGRSKYAAKALTPTGTRPLARVSSPTGMPNHSAAAATHLAATTYRLSLAGAKRVAGSSALMPQWVPVGSTSIQIASSAPAPTARSAQRAAIPGTAIAVLDAASARRAGASLALSLTGTGGHAGTGAVQLRVPDSVLNGLYGANYASRVRWQIVTSTGTTLTPRVSHSAGQKYATIAVPASSRVRSSRLCQYEALYAYL